MVETVLDLRPPEVLQKWPETRGCSIQRDSVSQQAVHVDMGVYETRDDHLVGELQDGVVRIIGHEGIHWSNGVD